MWLRVPASRTQNNKRSHQSSIAQAQQIQQLPEHICVRELSGLIFGSICFSASQYGVALLKQAGCRTNNLGNKHLINDMHNPVAGIDIWRNDRGVRAHQI